MKLKEKLTLLSRKEFEINYFPNRMHKTQILIQEIQTLDGITSSPLRIPASDRDHEWGSYVHMHTHSWGKAPPHFLPDMFHLFSVPLQDSACKYGFLLFSNVPTIKHIQDFKVSGKVYHNHYNSGLSLEVTRQVGRAVYTAGSEARNTLHHTPHSLRGGRAGAVLRRLTAETGGWKSLTSRAGGMLMYGQSTGPESRLSGISPASIFCPHPCINQVTSQSLSFLLCKRGLTMLTLHGRPLEQCFTTDCCHQ